MTPTLSRTALVPLSVAALSAALLVAAGPLAVLAVMVGAAVLLAVLRQPVLGLYAFAVLAPVIPYTTVNLGIRATLSEALLALTWAGILWQRFATGRALSWPRGPVERRVGWLIVWSLVPLVVGHFAIRYEANSLVNWLRWLLNLSFVVLVPWLTPEAAQRRRFIQALMLGFALMLTLSLGMFVQSPDARSMIPVLTAFRYAHPEAVQDIFSANYARMASPWVHPNATGAILLLIVPVAVFHGLGQTGWRRRLAIFVALAASAGIVFSGSRAALLCLAVLWVWLSWRQAPTARRTLLIGAGLLSLMLVAYPPAQKRLVSLFTSQDASTSVRMDEYRNFHQAATRYPVGLGFKLDPSPGFDGLLGISNFWLNYWYKLGLPGMLLIAWILRGWWREVRPPANLSRLSPDQALSVGCTCALMAALLTGFFDHTFSFTPVLQGFFWMMVALSLQHARHSFPDRPR